MAARRPVTALLLALLIALTAGPVAAAPRPTPASTGSPATGAGSGTALAERRAEADALREEVDRLHLAVETAAEDHTEATEDLAALVAGSLAAQARTDDLARTAADAYDERSGRIRALYMTGGGAGLYASVLEGRDLQDTVARLESVRSVVRAGVAAQEDVDSTRAQADAQAAAMARDAERRAELAAAAERARATVTASLARTQALLAAADADVVALAEARRVAVEREAARRAAEELARQELMAAAQAAAPQAAASLSAGATGGLAVPGAAGVPGGAALVALGAARAEQGKPYVWGATGPAGYDCSGLTQSAYRRAGVALPRTSREQWYAGTRVGLGGLAPGDLVFWAHDTGDPRTIHHVAMYAGDGLVVHAPRMGTLVRTAPLWLEGYIGAVRPTSAEGGPA